MDNNFIAHLRRSMHETAMISVYSNINEPDKCSVGIVEAVADEHFIMKHVTPNGLYDGYVIRRLDQIFRLDFNGQYEQRLELLYKLQNQRHQNFFKNKIKMSNFCADVLLMAQKSNFIVSVCIDETETQDDIVGFVNHVKDTESIISRISFEGLEDGESVFLIDDVVKINCDSEDERVLELLFNAKNH